MWRQIEENLTINISFLTQIIESWQRNWEELSQYFEFTAPIRRIIYTTNAVEGFHRQVRKVTKTKGAFVNDMALLKLVYLATKKVDKSTT
ncbi:transposase [Polaribacter sp. R77954]|uniref:transposase n=1 Tax=Polaribacter sp. R77954 TaxID=3093870 RepID=UPI0037CBFF29